MAKPDNKSKDQKGGKKESKKKAMQIWNVYSSQGGTLTRKNPTCPKCGDGVFMAVHKDRKSCGKCGFTEFGKK